MRRTYSLLAAKSRKGSLRNVGVAKKKIAKGEAAVSATIGSGLKLKTPAEASEVAAVLDPLPRKEIGGGDGVSIASLVGEAVMNAPTTRPSPTVLSSPSAPRQTVASLLQERQELLVSSDGGGLSSALRHMAADQIERRRSKPSVADSEFDVGMSERLLPELNRLTALVEVHSSDSTVEYWEEECLVKQLGQGHHEASERIVVNDVDEETTSFLSEDALARFGFEESVESGKVTDEKEEPISAGQQSCDAVAAQSHVRRVESYSWLPADGHIAFSQLSPTDCRTLYRYLRTLRGATEQELDLEDSSSWPISSLTAILDWLRHPSTPSPTIPFSSKRSTVRSPAFVFFLYSENISTQNAIGHLSSLFSIPSKSFITTAAASKMSSSTVLCAVASNCIRREQLLLTNAMRHPGFVLRIGNISEITDRDDATLFAEFARLSTVADVSLLLRRIRGTRNEITTRLDALSEVGAIFYCANRELSMVRAATDVLHGFYRSAVINALYKKKMSQEHLRFVRKPTVPNAMRARATANDSGIRQMLKAFIRSHGNFRSTVQQTPHPLRRKWINALRSLVWNTMASVRIRKGRALGHGRNVMVGDLLLRPEFRHDSELRKMANVKADHLMVCSTAEEAAAATLEDVFIPFFRGRYPEDLIAPEESGHPIMTRQNIIRILQKLHAPQLWFGLSDDAKRLLDIRHDASPMLFRRLLLRPLKLKYEILEDRPNERSLHYDAARLLLSPRLSSQSHLTAVGGSDSNTCNSTLWFEGDGPLPPDCGLVDRATLLRNSTFAYGKHLTGGTSFANHATSVKGVTTLFSGARDGVSAKQQKNPEAVKPTPPFFECARRQDYVVPGKAMRDMEGSFVAREPSSNDVADFDRLYTVSIKALLPHGLSGLLSLLREYFSLAGITTEEDSKLQHKIHRTRRELDAETAFMMAPQFCTACFNVCHDQLDICPEYLFKRSLFAEDQLMMKALAAGDGSGSGLALGSGDHRATTALTTQQGHFINEAPQIEVTFRRRTTESKWGIELTKDMLLQTIADPSTVVEVKPLFAGKLLEGGCETVLPASVQSVLLGEIRNPTPRIETSKPGQNDSTRFPSIIARLQEMLNVAVRATTNNDDDVSQSTLSDLRSALLDGNAPLVSLGLVTVAVDGEHTRSRKELASVFLQKKQHLSVTLTFEPQQYVLSAQQAVLDAQLVDKATEAAAAGATSLLSESDECRREIPPLSVSEHHALEGLPDEVQLILSRDPPEQAASWGIQVSKGSLCVKNIAALAHNKLDELQTLQHLEATTVPAVTFSSSGDIASALGKLDGDLYRVAAVDGIEVEDFAQLQLNFQPSLTRSIITLLLRKRSDLTLRRSPNDTTTKLESSSTDVTSTSSMEPLTTKLFESSIEEVQFTVALHRNSDKVKEHKWGVRLESNTLRLKQLPAHAEGRDALYFTVFAVKPRLAERISDELGSSRGPTADEMSHYAYFVGGVEHRRVSTPKQLRDWLQHSDKETVTLQCTRCQLLSVRVTLIRESTRVPWGVRFSSARCIDAIAPGSVFDTSLQHTLSAMPNGGPRSLRALVSAPPKQPLSKMHRDETSTSGAAVAAASILLSRDDDDEGVEPPSRPSTEMATNSVYIDDALEDFENIVWKPVAFAMPVGTTSESEAVDVDSCFEGAVDCELDGQRTLSDVMTSSAGLQLVLQQMVVNA